MIISALSEGRTLFNDALNTFLLYCFLVGFLHIFTFLLAVLEIFLIRIALAAYICGLILSTKALFVSTYFHAYMYLMFKQVFLSTHLR